jgi:hypothetical protein
VLGAGRISQDVGQLAVYAVEQRSAEKQPLDFGRLALQRLGDQVIGDGPAATRELHYESLRIRVLGQGDRRQTKTGRPSFRPILNGCHSLVGEDDGRRREQCAGLGFREAKVGCPDLRQLTSKPEVVQAKRQVATHAQYRVHVRRKPGQEASETRVCRRPKPARAGHR